MTRRILIASPATRESRSGNRVTSNRWHRVLTDLGFDVRQAQTGELEADEDFGDPDVLIAIHARKLADVVARFQTSHADRRIVVALAGTDLYGDQPPSPETLTSLTAAARIVVLQPAALEELTPSHREKARVIYQSVAREANLPRHPSTPHRWLAVGHLRPVKDPATLIQALRLLPPHCPVQVDQLGEILDPSLESLVESAQKDLRNYRWLGSLSRSETHERLARSQGLIHPSRHEGGANAVGEAISMGRPVLASDIPGNLGLLGEDYPGVFPPGDGPALASLLERADRDSKFYDDLCEATRARESLFSPVTEREAWQSLMLEII